jgi:hypothetical protein
MANSKNIGTLRTGLPAAWATAFTWVVAKFGLDLQEEDYAMLMIIVPIVIPVFYRLSREIEQRFPWLGKLIFGSTASPSYDSDK